MLKIEELSFAIAGRPLFEGASARVPAGHKVGVIGPNGAGKTTLFKLIRGEISLDSGSISLPEKSRIGGVSQEAPANNISLLDTVLEADTERARLLNEAETAENPQRIAEIQMRLADIDAWSAEARASSILQGLGFDSRAQSRPTSEFSGGWRMRVALAAVLFSAPDWLLLDEPTNYLDLEGTLWLESYLARYPHGALVISHDRGLLDRAVQSILQLDQQKLTLWRGGFNQFLRQRAEREAGKLAAAKKQEVRRAELQRFVDRFRAKASKAKQAQSRLKQLEKMEPVAALDSQTETRFSFPEPETLSPPIVRLDQLSLGYDNTAILRNISLRIDQDDRIALLGRNGEGKSTFAKALAGRLSPMAGEITRSRKLRIGFFAQHQLELLEPEESPLTHLARERPEEAPTKHRARLAGFGLGASIVELPCKALSGGQRARLALLLATLDAPHLLILDEPTNHLDMESREALIEALSAYSGAVLLIAHDMHLLSLVADRLWLVKNGAVQPYEGDLEQYRSELLQKPEAKNAPRKRKPEKPAQDRNGELERIKGILAEYEAKIEQLNALREKLHARLGDAELYTNPAREKDHALMAQKDAELEAALERAEARWLAAASELEKLES